MLTSHAWENSASPRTLSLYGTAAVACGSHIWMSTGKSLQGGEGDEGVRVRHCSLLMAGHLMLFMLYIKMHHMCLRGRKNQIFKKFALQYNRHIHTYTRLIWSFLCSQSFRSDFNAVQSSSYFELTHIYMHIFIDSLLVAPDGTHVCQVNHVISVGSLLH